jgi:hypothetical protein
MYSHHTGYIRDGALAIQHGRIVAVGPRHHIEALAGATTHVTRYAPEALILPGFCDSHQHFLSYIRGKVERISLWDATSLQEVAQRIRRAASQHPVGTWLIADGHDQGRYVEQRHPTLAELDQMAPAHPLIVHRACHHIALVNSHAMMRANLTAETTDPVGGRIGRDAQGALTGILEENARTLVLSHVTLPPIEWHRHIPQAVNDYHRRGITAIGEAAIGHIDGLNDLAVMEAAYQRGEMTLRTSYFGYGDVARAWINGEAHIAPDAWRNAPMVKYFIDGTLGGESAWLSQAYRHTPHNCGYPLISAPELTHHIETGHRAGYQVAVHAIGDAAVDLVANTYADVLSRFPRTDHRHRIEHVEVVRPETIRLMAQHGIIAAVQPLFTWYEESDVAQVPDALLPYAHAWRQLANAGVSLAFGSDNPVVPDFAPLSGIAAAVNCTNHRGQPVNPGQQLSWQAAVDAFTRQAAFSLRREHEFGDFVPGHWADVVVIDGNLHDPAAIHHRTILATWVAGTPVYEAS